MTVNWNKVFIPTLHLTATGWLLVDKVEKVGAAERQLVAALGIDPPEVPQSGPRGKTHGFKAYAAQQGIAHGGSPRKGAA